MALLLVQKETVSSRAARIERRLRELTDAMWRAYYKRDLISARQHHRAIHIILHYEESHDLEEPTKPWLEYAEHLEFGTLSGLQHYYLARFAYNILSDFHNINELRSMLGTNRYEAITRAIDEYTWPGEDAMWT